MLTPDLPAPALQALVDTLERARTVPGQPLPVLAPEDLEASIQLLNLLLDQGQTILEIIEWAQTHSRAVGISVGDSTLRSVLQLLRDLPLPPNSTVRART